MNRDDIELYVMGEHDGDPSVLEAELDRDPALRQLAANEAMLELLMRDAAADATFCAACDDLVRGAIEAPRGERNEREGKQPSRIDRCDACGAAVRPGGYVVERVLVSNAHGRMYIARDADGKQVALKELAFVQSPTLEVIAAFEREAKLLRALEHPAIPRFVASFEEGSGIHARYYLAQELVTGASLADELENHWFSEAEAIQIAREVLTVLVYLQNLSPLVIHRDIKPANLLRRADKSIAVVDFGAAHVQGATAGSTSIGTFGYMPIEQLAGQVDATTDLYALGASLVHLLGRREPWRLLTGASIEGINVSPAMRDFLSKLVAPEPCDRFANAKLALEALDHAAEGGRILPFKRVRNWIRPLIYAAASLALVGSGIGIHHVLSSTDTDKPVEIKSTPSGDKPVAIFAVDAGVGADSAPEAVLRVDLPDTITADLFVDGARMATVKRDATFVLTPGRRMVRMISPGGHVCEQQVSLSLGKVTTVACMLQQDMVIKSAGIAHADAEHPKGKFRADQCQNCHKPQTKFVPVKVGDPLEPELPAGDPNDFTFEDQPIEDVVRTIGERCGFNTVIPDFIQGRVSLRLKKVPCDQALEVLLESRGLWYAYHPEGKLLRIADRRELDRERLASAERGRLGATDDVLPAGGTIDLDFKEAPIRDLFRMLAASANVNIVIPEELSSPVAKAAKVTLRVKRAPWDKTFHTILAAHGLWYRYRPNGKVVRVADRKELDREFMAERERAKLP